jgi:hypothetical protein
MRETKVMGINQSINQLGYKTFSHETRQPVYLPNNQVDPNHKSYNNLPFKLRKRTVACSPAPIGTARSMQLPLTDRRDFTGTSQPMLGVLFFPLGPPCCKGTTHTIQISRLAPSLPRKVELPLLSELGIPTPHK